MLHNLRSILLIIVFACIVTACGEGDSSSQPTATQPAATPAKPAETVTPAAPPSPPVVQETTAPVVTEPAAPGPAPVVEQTVPEAATVVTEPAPAAQTPAPETPPVAAPVATPSGSPQTHTINAEARVFNPDIIYVQPGDTVQWTNMTSHNSVSIDGLIPAGATPWQGQLGENLQVTLTVAGIYGYYCQPHIGFGMMGVIVVGKPTNLDEVKSYADKNLQGPFRRILGKLNKVTLP